LGANSAPTNIENLAKQVVFLESPTANVEMCATEISLPHHPIKVRVCTELSFSRNIVGGLGYPKFEKFTRQSRARYLQNGADGKQFDRRPLYCAVVLHMARPTGNKNLDSEKNPDGGTAQY
jgi:hypothetical protein